MQFFEKHPIPLLAVGIVGTALSAIFVKYSDAPSIVTATYRLLWTVLLMSPLIVFSKKFRKELITANKKTVALCAVSGIFLTLHFTLWFESLNHTSVASSTAIVCTEVIWVALGFRMFLGGSISKKAWISIFITIIGSLIIALADVSAGGNNFTGDFLSLAAAISAAIYTLIGRLARESMTTTVYTYIVYLFCAISLCIALYGSGLSFSGYGPSAIIVGLLLCLFSTLLGHSIFSWSLKFTSPAFISASKLCQPAVAAVFAFFLFNEIPSLLLIVGGIITILGVLYYSKVEAS